MKVVLGHEGCHQRCSSSSSARKNKHIEFDRFCHGIVEQRLLESIFSLPLRACVLRSTTLAAPLVSSKSLVPLVVAVLPLGYQAK